MNREMSSIEDDEEIFEVASEFEDPVVRRYAAVLRDAHVTLKSFERTTIAQELVAAGIPEIPAGDITDAFRKYLARGSVGVFWDLENVGLPPNVKPLECLAALRDVIIRKFGQIQDFKAYVDLAVFANDFSPETRVSFRDCGVEMVDAPHNKRKEVADKHIIVDALWFALHTKDPIVCIISGDSDFSPLLSKLKMNGIPTIVISTSKHVRSLREQSRWALSWPEDFMVGAHAPRDQGQRNRSGGSFPAHLQAPGSQPGAGGRHFTTSPRRSSPSLNAMQPNNQVSSRLSPSMIRQTNSPPSIGEGTPGPQLPPNPSPNFEGNSEESCSSQFTDFVDCVKHVQSDVGMKKVRRSAVGIEFKRINPVVPFKKVVADAEAAGLVKLGGQLGHAWIALSSDHVDEETHGQPNAGNDAPSDGANNASSTDEKWWISLRFNQSFACYGTLQSFQPDPGSGVYVSRFQEPQGRWHRMGVGPFKTLMEADNYCTLNFGELQILPKITQNLKRYLDPPLLPPGA